MAKLVNSITYERPCYVKGEKALFYNWFIVDKAIINNNVMLRPQDEREALEKFKETGYLPKSFEYVTTVSSLVGLVVYEDGRVDMVDPLSIQFADVEINDYIFSKGE